MTKYLITGILFCWGLGGATLQEQYQAAGPGQGYDKVISLEPGLVYTGGISIYDETVVIHGQGAVVNLQGGSITVQNYLYNNTRLDIDHCVLINGANALDYSNSANGHITNNTFYGNAIGVKIYYCDSESSSIVNCIFSGNTQFAVLCRMSYYPRISYNCCFNNAGDYYDDCG